jgi:thioredoxin 1
MQDFKNGVLNKSELILVDFWAPWCRYCILLEPTLKELEEKFDKFSVYKVNVDERPELAQEYGVMSLPTLRFFKDGKELDIEVSDRSIEALSEIVNNNL